MKVYITISDVISADGKQTIKTGKLVMAYKAKITTLDGKIAIDINAGMLKNYIKPCKLTCTANEILIMEFRTDYHTYYAIGQNPHIMYQKIIKRYNGNSGQKFNTGNFHNGTYDYDTKISDDYSVNITKLNIEDCIYWDDESEFRDNEGLTKDRNMWLDNKKSNKIVFCGNWFDLYKSNNPKCFPNKTMK